MMNSVRALRIGPGWAGRAPQRTEFERQVRLSAHATETFDPFREHIAWSPNR